MTDFTTLTESLFKNIKVYQDYLQSAGLPQPSHVVAPTAASNPAPIHGHALPKDVAAALENAKEESHELYTLLLNPVELVIEAFPNVRSFPTLSFACLVFH